MLNRTKTLAERFEEAYRKPVPYEGLISDEIDFPEADEAPATEETAAQRDNFARLLSWAMNKPSPNR